MDDIQNNNPSSAATALLNNEHNPDDDDSIFKGLNAIILQHLEVLGLEESYNTFYKECVGKGVPLPNDLPDPSFPKTNFNLCDGKQFLEYFDSENGEALAEMWSNFLQELDNSTRKQLEAVTFYLHIFIAIVPYRQQKTYIEKSNGMAKLRQFFQECHKFNVDQTMLSLFALPFVQNPMEHPNFKEIFQDPWKEKLKSQINQAFSQHLRKFYKPNPDSNSELTHMFLNFIQSDSEGDEFSENTGDDEEERGLIHSSRKHYKKKSSFVNEELIIQLQNDLQKCNDKMSKMKDAIQRSNGQNHKLNKELHEAKKKLYFIEDRYYKLIRSTAEVVSSLELAVQGKFQNIEELRDRLQHVFPELFAPGKERNPGTSDSAAALKVEEKSLKVDNRDSTDLMNNNDELIWQQEDTSRRYSSETDDENLCPLTPVPKTIHVPSRSKTEFDNLRQKSYTVLQHNSMSKTRNTCDVPKSQSRHASLTDLPPPTTSVIAHHDNFEDKDQTPLICTKSSNTNYKPSQLDITKSSPPHTKKRSTTIIAQQHQQNLIAEDHGSTNHRNEDANASSSSKNRNQSHLPIQSASSSARVKGSISPTNLRANFEPITKLKHDRTFVRNLNISNETLRTETRTIIPLDNTLLTQKECLSEGPAANKTKKSFKRSTSTSIKSEENSESRPQVNDNASLSKPRRKWLQKDNSYSSSHEPGSTTMATNPKLGKHATGIPTAVQVLEPPAGYNVNQRYQSLPTGEQLPIPMHSQSLTRENRKVKPQLKASAV